jgi:hypothetical protein
MVWGSTHSVIWRPISPCERFFASTDAGNQERFIPKMADEHFKPDAETFELANKERKSRKQANVARRTPWRIISKIQPIGPKSGTPSQSAGGP